MGRKKGIGRITTSVTLSPEFFNLAKTHRVGFTEATRIGLALIFAERGITEYDNKLNIYRRMKVYQQKVEELVAEMEELKQNAEKRQD